MTRLLCRLPDPARYGAKADVGASDLLTKASHAILEVKADGEDGQISGYGSVFEKVDSYGEMVMPGAFKKSLQRWRREKRPIPMLWQHRSEQPVGGWSEYEEDSKGLKLAGQLNLETQRGREAWSDVKAQIVGGLSIGYYEVKADPYDYDSTDPRKLIELDLRETSVVTFPALREATIDAVKARILRGERLTVREFESFLREKLNLSRAMAEDIAALGYKAWLAREGAPGPAFKPLADELAELRSMPALSLPSL